MSDNDYKKCPKCGIWEVDGAEVCACGYEFSQAVPVDDKANFLSRIRLTNFRTQFLIGFLGWFILASIYWQIIMKWGEGYGDGALIVALFCFPVPTIVTVIVIFVSFFWELYNDQVKQDFGLAAGVLVAFLLNAPIVIFLSIRDVVFSGLGLLWFLGVPFFLWDLL